MASGSTIAGSRSEHRGFSYWMERVLKELEKVRTAPDPDSVHDLRVAIRRCRSVAAAMEEVDTFTAWAEMRQLGRKLFRDLGELRDIQVLEDWVRRLSEDHDPIRQQLLSTFEKRETELREAALRAIGKFDGKTWRKLEGRLSRRVRLVPVDGPVAEGMALERLEAAKELHARALRTEQPAPWHELRIGVKRFRYTVESLLPARYQVWETNLKRVQDLLGDVHDLDVLAGYVDEANDEQLKEYHSNWKERIAAERMERLETYRQMALGKTSLWQEWRTGLPQGESLQAASLARISVTVRALGAGSTRASQVNRIALRLFEGLRRVHSAPEFDGAEAKLILRAAAKLHSVSDAMKGKAPHKEGRKFVRRLALPAGWSAEDWTMVALTVRYHRGAQPKPKHKAYARLSEGEQRRLACLAGVLRLARVLRKCGVERATGMRVIKSQDAILVEIPNLANTEQTAAKLGAGKHLLESVLPLPLLLKSVAPRPVVVHLQKKEEEIAQTAIASD